MELNNNNMHNMNMNLGNPDYNLNNGINNGADSRGRKRVAITEE